MRRTPNAALDLPFGLVAAAFVVLVCMGVWRAHSPVPFWDMWDGYLDFFMKVPTEPALWWTQHNEHRITLSRGLFWLDLELFRGTGAFLVACNVVLLGGAVAVLAAMVDEATLGRERWLVFLSVAWSFMWIQHENLTVGFQTQFMLAQGLPLAAFWLLHRSASSPDGGGAAFAGAFACGVLSLGSMANGVLALPLMTAFALVARMGARRVAVLGVAAIACTALYFHGYHATDGHGSLSLALREKPLQLAHFTALYLGAPFVALVGPGRGGLEVGAAMGAAMMLACVVCAVRVLPRGRDSTLQLAALAFLAYVGGTAVGTAGGRLPQGLAAALSSRYTTPSLMAWVVLLVLLVLEWRRARGTAAPARWGTLVRRVAIVAAVVLLARMTVMQRQALERQDAETFERSLAALALAMSIDDAPQVRRVYPGIERAATLAAAARERGLTVFGLPPWRGAAAAIGAPSSAGARDEAACEGALESVEPVRDQPDWLRVSGRLVRRDGARPDPRLELVDGTGVVRGLALAGPERAAPGRPASPGSRRGGFAGYLRADAVATVRAIVDPASGCRLAVTAAPPLFAESAAPRDAMPVVDASRIVDRGGFARTDAAGATLAGHEVAGSFVRSDGDTGSILLRLADGDALMLRTGPTRGRQLIEVVGRPETRRLLPEAADWVRLTLVLPDAREPVEVRVSDAGDGWGEWSAVALRTR